MEKKIPSPIDAAAARMREVALRVPDGELLGSEDEILAVVGVSRVTLRQAARLLEREGLLRVMRGKKGGYFSARPSVESVERVVCGYLNTLGLGAEWTAMVSTSLWVEVMRQAAGADREVARNTAATLIKIIESVDDEASVEELAAAEQAQRSAVFALINGAYVELLFRVNAAFARQRIADSGAADYVVPDPDRHRTFVRKWKRAKIMEAEAIAEGDVLAAGAAALHERSLWIGRRARSSDKSSSGTGQGM